MTIVDYSIVIGFLLVMAFAGLAITRLIKTSDDFFVAGRELTPFVLCATITATNLSMYQFISIGGIAYQSGISVIWQNWTGDMALVLCGILVVPLMRRLQVRSIPEFLELRYTKGLRTLVGAFWGIRLCIYLGILLYIASTAAIGVTGCADTTQNYVRWLAAFSVVSIIYSAIGGAWAVAIMDSVQFCIMLLGALIVLPIVMHAVGGVPGIVHTLNSTGQSSHLSIVPSTGEFGWLFISAYMLLGFKWSSIDQSILQRAFGAKTPRISAKAMVLSGIITTPLAFFWVLPGLAASCLHPGFDNPDKAVPWLLAAEIPAVAKGLLGVVLCGLIAAQISAITADVNSVATLFTSDVYRSLRKRAPSQQQLLIVVRASSIVCGTLMLLVALYLRTTNGGGLRANYTITGILDMPLFVVTVIYGLLWKRANWQGATAGFLLGGFCGIFTHFLITNAYFDSYLFPLLSHISMPLANFAAHINHYFGPYQKQVRNVVPIVSSGAALIITPIVSLLTSRSSHGHFWNALNAEDNKEEKDAFHVIPRTLAGQIALAVTLIGFGVFVVGILSAHWASGLAAPMAIIGMLSVFAGGVVRVCVK